MGNTSATPCSCEEKHWKLILNFKKDHFYAEKKVRATWNVSQMSMKEPTKEIWRPSRAISSIELCMGGPGVQTPMSLLEQSENHLHVTGIFLPAQLRCVEKTGGSASRLLLFTVPADHKCTQLLIKTWIVFTCSILSQNCPHGILFWCLCIFWEHKYNSYNFNVCALL